MAEVTEADLSDLPDPSSTAFGLLVAEAVALLRGVRQRGTVSGFERARLEKLLKRADQALRSEPLMDNAVVELVDASAELCRFHLRLASAVSAWPLETAAGRLVEHLTRAGEAAA
jgi:hypothetical protein